MRLGENFRLPDRPGWLNVDDDRTPHRSDSGSGEESRPAMGAGSSVLLISWGDELGTILVAAPKAASSRTAKY
jgi:hypothetical protein